MYKESLVFAAVMACGGSQTDEIVSSDEALLPPEEGTGVQLALDVLVPAGEELFKCQYVEPSEKSYDVKRWESWYAAGSHHLLLYSTIYSDLPRKDIFDCGEIGELGIRGIAYGAQSETSEASYPEGVAMHFDAEDTTEHGGTVLLYQTHYINTTGEDIDASLRTNVYFAQPDEVTQYAGTLFFYNYNIAIPAGVGSEGSTSMRCPIPEDINLLGAVSHMHRRGKTFTSYQVGSDEMLFETLDWEAPDPRLFETPLAISAGSEIEFTCEYENDRDDATVEGTSADVNEMCIFVSGYYPKLPAEEEFCLNGSPVFTGEVSCGDTLNCHADCGDDEVCKHECTAQLCESGGVLFQAFIRCGFENDCIATDDAKCFGDYCLTEYLACQAATVCE